MAAAGQAPNNDRGQQVYVICGACHGAQGQGDRSLKAPSLAGQQQSYLFRQLRNFSSGVRGGAKDDLAQQMRQVLDLVSDEADWKAVSAYISALPIAYPAPSIHGNVDRGRQIYGSCAACHGSSAEGSRNLEAPNLRLLPDWYIVDELRKYREERRGTHPADVAGAQMRAASVVLRSQEDVIDVTSYIRGE
jgi:cytochrome c oxidase subunit 2